MRYVVAEHMRTFTVCDIDTGARSEIDGAEYYHGIENGSLIGEAAVLLDKQRYDGVQEDDLDMHYTKQNILVGSLKIKEVLRPLQISMRDVATNVAISSDLSHIVYSLEIIPRPASQILDYLRHVGYVRFDVLLYKDFYNKYTACIRFNLPKILIKELRRELDNVVIMTKKGDSEYHTSDMYGGYLTSHFRKAVREEFAATTSSILNKNVTLNRSGLIFEVSLNLVDPGTQE